MTIKPWRERPVDQRNELGSQLVNMQDEIDELREALKAQPVPTDRHELESELRDLIDLHTHAYDVVNRAADVLDAQHVQPSINYEPLHKFATDNRISYNELCAVVQAAVYAAPVQPAPLTDAQIDAAVMYGFGYINDSCRKGMRKAIESAIKGGAT